MAMLTQMLCLARFEIVNLSLYWSD